MPENIKKWETTTTIGLHGNSLVVNVTQGCRLLGIDRGDLVKITIEKVDEEN